MTNRINSVIFTYERNNNINSNIFVFIIFRLYIETGKSQINLRRLLQVGKVLDVPPEELISGTYIYSERYLDREMSDILLKCSPKAQQLIYKMADLIADMQLV